MTGRHAVAMLMVGMLCVAGCARPNDALVEAKIASYVTASPSKTNVEARYTRTQWEHAAQPLNPKWQVRPRGKTDAPIADPVSGKPYAPWPVRVGPAYPGRFWPSVGRDLKELPETFWDDTKATFNYPLSLALLGAAAATGAALQGEANDEVEKHFTRKGSQLSTFWDSVGDVGGSPLTHFLVAGTMYAVALHQDDDKNYEKAKTLINALAVTGAMTVGLKVVFNTESPNGDDWGWPSGHSSSSFCFATVMCEQYGPAVGIPLFAFAGFVAYERVDARNHDFNDVVSGALIGIAVGYAVSKNHQFQVLGMDVIPFADPRGGGGISLRKQW